MEVKKLFLRSLFFWSLFLFGGLALSINRWDNAMAAPQAAEVPTLPPTLTSTPTQVPTLPPTLTSTPTQVPTLPTVPPTSTSTPTALPTLTSTPTNTAVPPTNTPTNTPVPPTSTPTNTAVPPTNTPTNTPVPPTSTPTNTAVPSTSTPTNTPVSPTSTPTQVPTLATVLPTLTSAPTNTLVPPTNTPTVLPTLTNTPVATPLAVNDATGTLQGKAVIIAPLVNDRSQSDNALLTIIALSAPTQGTATIRSGGQTVIYTPTVTFVGLDTFTYTVEDSRGARATAQIAVVVTAQKDSATPQVVLVDNTKVTTATFISRVVSVQISLPPGSYNGSAGPLGPNDIFYIAYTEILTPTASVTTPPAALNFAGHIFTLDAFFNTTKLADYVFPQPITVTVSYEPNEINDLDPATLQLYYWNTKAVPPVWTDDGLSLVARDTVAHTITYQIAHLTEFAFFGKPQPAAFQTYLPLISNEWCLSALGQLCGTQRAAVPWWPASEDAP